MMKSILVPFVLACAAASAWSGGTGEAPATREVKEEEAPRTVPASSPKQSFAGSLPAPEFPAGLEWINVSSPLTLASLRGKVVLLDFWTYGCINCIHNLPYIKALLEEFKSELVVIGVHSAKFENEGRGDGIRSVVRRYEISYPVVNDREYKVWDQWGARAWPTLVLVDPEGNVVGGKSGEGFYDTFRQVIGSLVEEFSAKGRIDRRPVAIESERKPSTVLSFPGKVKVDGRTDRLFVANSGHHRMVVAEAASGKILDVAGGGPGFKDGSFADARFRNPQGLALSADGGTLYVADTDNHAVRALDLSSRTVSTIAGTGAQAEAYPPEPGVGTKTALSSPWDLALRGNELYVAMAGSHQIWRIDLPSRSAEPLAGSGAEGWSDGPGAEAELAQPSGLALAGDRLYFADSEGSSIRYVDLSKREHPVVTLAGSGKSLFEFGFREGIGNGALFQHPLGVAFDGGVLYAADTYNHRIRKIDPATGRTDTVAGGDGGFRNGKEARFDEPGGLDVSGGRLYVADTNNHTVRIVDPVTGETSSLVLKGADRLPGTGGASAPLVLAPVVAGTGAGEIRIAIELPKGWKPNPDAPSSFTVKVRGSGVTLTRGGELAAAGPRLPLVFPAAFSEGRGTLDVEVNLVYCETERESLCYLERRILEIPYRVEAGAAPILSAGYAVTPGK